MVYHNRAFTLIELLVVFAIIGILSAVIMASMNQARAQSRDGKRTTDIKQLQLALGLYYDANNVYPLTISTSTLGPYIPAIPIDPSSNGTTIYRYDYVPYCASDNATVVSYHIGTSLENSGNSALQNDVDSSNYNNNVFSGCSINGTIGSDFTGSDTAKCMSSDPGLYCYDATP